MTDENHTRSTTSPGNQAAIPDDMLRLVRRLSSSIDARDSLNAGRTYRIARFSVRIGERIGLDAAALRDLEVAALLHDIGKSALHTGLLLKAGPLSAEERAMIRSYPELGYEILSDIPALRRAAEIVRAQHERPDGTGYPRQLRGEEIPVESAIILAVIAFDSMTSHRPYRHGLSAGRAYDELRECSGTMFESRVVEAFVDLHTSGKLFADFDEMELARYISGHSSSRAFQDYFAAHPDLVARLRDLLAVELAADDVIDLELPDDFDFEAGDGDDAASDGASATDDGEEGEERLAA